ncbi:PhoU domain-containing protein [Desulfocicer niacini]
MQPHFHIEIFAGRQPLAQDLRHILTSMKISHELERIALAGHLSSYRPVHIKA